MPGLSGELTFLVLLSLACPHLYYLLWVLILVELHLLAFVRIAHHDVADEAEGTDNDSADYDGYHLSHANPIVTTLIFGDGRVSC